MKDIIINMCTVFEKIRNYKTDKIWTHIIIHHSLTKDGLVVDSEAIKKYHIEVKGWIDCGYNWLAENVNNEMAYIEGRLMTMYGAHTKGMNHCAIGICLIGNYDIVEPTHLQYFYLASLCRELMRKFGIPIYRILGHRSFSAKSCPGELFNMVKLRNYIEGNTQKYI